MHLSHDSHMTSVSVINFSGVYGLVLRPDFGSHLLAVFILNFAYYMLYHIITNVSCVAVCVCVCEHMRLCACVCVPMYICMCIREGECAIPKCLHVTSIACFSFPAGGETWPPCCIDDRVLRGCHYLLGTGHLLLHHN